MTKGEIKSAVASAIDDALPTILDTQILDQTQLTTATNAGASGLDTVNPNGPHYPSTPR